MVAESLILICGKFDLSLESTVGVAPMVAAWLMIRDRSIGGSGVSINGYHGIAVVLVLGLPIALINGLVVVKLKLNAFITTLAVLTLLCGMTLGITNGQTLGTAKWLGIPVSIGSQASCS